MASRKRTSLKKAPSPSTTVFASGSSQPARRTNGKPVDGAAAPVASSIPSVPPELLALQAANHLQRYLASIQVERREWASQNGLSFDGRRDTYKILGYKRTLTINDYCHRYERGGIAKKIVDFYPRTVWAGGASIFEDEDPNAETPFETMVHDMFDRLQMWGMFQNAHIMARWCNYSVIVLLAPTPQTSTSATSLTGEVNGQPGIDQSTINNTNSDSNSDVKSGSDTGHRQPLMRGVGNPDSIVGILTIPQDRAKIVKWCRDKTSPNYGMPEIYNIRVGSLDRNNNQNGAGFTDSFDVHASRVIHVAQGALENRISGKPALESVWNLLDDLDKIIGGGAEAYWRRMNPGMSLDIPPDIQFKEGEEEALEDVVEDYELGYTKFLKTRGATVKPLSATLIGFASEADKIIDLIAGTEGIPKRILIGSERGELASTSDQDNKNDHADQLRMEFAIPLVRTLIDRLIEFNYLPKPAKYVVEWPDIEELSEDEKASVALKMAQANNFQKQASGTIIYLSNEIREDVSGKEELTEEEMTPKLPEPVVPPPGAGGLNGKPNGNPNVDTTPPTGKSKIVVNTKASKAQDKISAAFLSVWEDEDADFEIDEEDSEDEEAIYLSMLSSMEETENRLLSVLPGLLLAALVDGATSAFRATSSSHAVKSTDFDPIGTRAVEWSTSRAKDLIAETGELNREAIRGLISDSLSKGETLAELSSRVNESIGLRPDQLESVNNLYANLSNAKPGDVISAGELRIEIPDSGPTEAFMSQNAGEYVSLLRSQRADLIARTESSRALQEGKRELWMQAQDQGHLPDDQLRTWIANTDRHEELDGQEVGLDEDFDPPIEPGEEPNCLCDQELVEMKEATTDEISANKKNARSLRHCRKIKPVIKRHPVRNGGNKNE